VGKVLVARFSAPSGRGSRRPLDYADVFYKHYTLLLYLPLYSARILAIKTQLRGQCTCGKYLSNYHCTGSRIVEGVSAAPMGHHGAINVDINN
jgi:hypothetical protein